MNRYILYSHVISARLITCYTKLDDNSEQEESNTWGWEY